MHGWPGHSIVTIAIITVPGNYKLFVPFSWSPFSALGVASDSSSSCRAAQIARHGHIIERSRRHVKSDFFRIVDRYEGLRCCKSSTLPNEPPQSRAILATMANLVPHARPDRAVARGSDPSEDDES